MAKSTYSVVVKVAGQQESVRRRNETLKASLGSNHFDISTAHEDASPLSLFLGLNFLDLHWLQETTC